MNSCNSSNHLENVRFYLFLELGGDFFIPKFCISTTPQTSKDHRKNLTLLIEFK